MRTQSSFNVASIYLLFTVTGSQIGGIACQINSTVGGAWELQSTTLDGDDELFIQYPQVASADLSVMAMGDPYYAKVYDYSFSNFGRARVIRYNTDNSAMPPQWEQLGADIDGDKYDDYFGTDLALSADGLTIAVGGNGHDGDGPDLESIGHVRILKFNTVTNKWKQVGADIEGDEAYDASGMAVTISADGTIVAIASPYHGSFGTVRVYQFNLTTRQWEQLGTDIDNDIYRQNFGNIITMSGDGKTIVIGSRDEPDFGYLQAYTYSTSSKQWNVLGAVLTGPQQSKNFGYQFSLSGDGTTLAATSNVLSFDTNDERGTYEYHVHVYKYSKVTASWSQVGDLIETGGSDFDSGLSFDISNDGKTIAFGIHRNRRVRVYTNTNDGTSVWKRVGNNIKGSVFFVAVSADGTSIAIKGEQLRVFTFVPTPKPPACEISWNLYNAKTNTLLAPLVNGTIIANPPPCNQTNIEAVVPCTPSNGTLSMELYSVNATTAGKLLSLVYRRRERSVPFFLYGNRRNNDIYGGHVPSGTYMIRAFDNAVGTPSPFTQFTLGGNCV